MLPISGTKHTRLAEIVVMFDPLFLMQKKKKKAFINLSWWNDSYACCWLINIIHSWNCDLVHDHLEKLVPFDIHDFLFSRPCRQANEFEIIERWLQLSNLFL